MVNREKVDELLNEYKGMLAASKRQTQGFTEHEAGYAAGQEAVLEDIVEKLNTILNNENGG